MKNIKSLKVFSFIISITLMNCFLSYANAQSCNNTKNDSDMDKLVGIWEGNLLVESTELPLVFKVSKDSSNNFKATLDSPSQNAYDVPLGELSFNDGEVKIDAPYLAAYYTDRFTDDLTLKGTWNQAGYSFPLTLIKKS